MPAQEARALQAPLERAESGQAISSTRSPELVLSGRSDLQSGLSHHIRHMRDEEIRDLFDGLCQAPPSGDQRDFTWRRFREAFLGRQDTMRVLYGAARKRADAKPSGDSRLNPHECLARVRDAPLCVPRRLSQRPRAVDRCRTAEIPPAAPGPSPQPPFGCLARQGARAIARDLGRYPARVS